MCSHLCLKPLKVKFMCFQVVRPGCFPFHGVSEKTALSINIFIVFTNVIDQLIMITK